VRRITVIDTTECRQLLGAHRFARIAVIRDRTPLVVPIQYCYDGLALLYRTAGRGLLDPGTDLMPVAVEIDGIDPLYHLGWNVTVQGVARRSPDDPPDARRLEPWLERDHPCTVMVVPHTISGRRIAGP
jgi:nitroimidazol reductase NimA-like FMN-containing flavoprotein (pyridoxamine 5'-phosphate oxidase superfamily)